MYQDFSARISRISIGLAAAESNSRSIHHRILLTFQESASQQDSFGTSCFQRRPQADKTLLNPEVHLYRNVYFRGAPPQFI
jgi:hypothetical protein